MSRPLLLTLLVAVVLFAGSAAPGRSGTAEAECGTAGCGVPRCEAGATAPVRAGRTRRVTLSCDNAVAVQVRSAPDWVVPTGASVVQAFTVSVDVRVRADAPSAGELELAVEGHEGSMVARLRLQVVPDGQNRAPVCDGDRASQRSDGRTTVAFHLHPYCRDPDGDAFVMRGAGPGQHRDDPKSVPAGESESNWAYETATTNGTERATVQATDELGARSAPAPLEVTVGPAIDRLPQCHTNPGSYVADGVQTVRTRAGAIRRFALICEDLDGDPLTPQLARPPENGLLAGFALGEPSTGWWGLQRWIDATYVPSDGIGADEFALGATGSRGAGPTSRIAITPVRGNFGGGCGWSPADVLVGTPAVLEVVCTDDEGDPLSIEVVEPPRHGRTGPPVVTPAPYAQTSLRVPYVPDPGYTGYDCVRVRVTDGQGSAFRLDIDVDVHELRLTPPPIDLPDVTMPPLTLPPNGLPNGGLVWGGGPLPGSATGAYATTGGGGAARDEAASVGTASEEDAVRAALETTGPVVELKAPAGVRAWTPARIGRKALLRTGRAPGVLAVCTRTCSLGTSAALRVGRPARRSGRPRATRTDVAAGQARVVWMTVDARQRRALRRTRSASADVRVSARVGRRAQRTVRRAIRVAG